MVNALHFGYLGKTTSLATAQAKLAEEAAAGNSVALRPYVTGTDEQPETLWLVASDTPDVFRSRSDDEVFGFPRLKLQRTDCESLMRLPNVPDRPLTDTEAVAYPLLKTRPGFSDRDTKENQPRREDPLVLDKFLNKERLFNDKRNRLERPDSGASMGDKSWVDQM